jgi:hypothetical protein
VASQLTRLLAVALFSIALTAGTAGAQAPPENTCSHFLARCKEVACARARPGWSCDTYCQGKFDTCLHDGNWADTVNGKTYSGLQKQ